MLSAAEVIRLLDLRPHPEGGHFRETFRDVRTVEGGRAASTAIYFLLARGERSHWHRVDAAEVWHFYAGAPLMLEAMADGVQIYACEAQGQGFEWVFKAPEADLFDLSGKKIGKHYAGPTWESNDGSKVVGEVKARDDGPAATAIPWLLLSAKSTSGKGVFSQTQSIQRLYTVGGKAPAGACTRAQLGKEARVPYKATYYFYSARP